jgi:hypothetical protein
MSILQKSNSRLSSRRQINIEGVKDDVLLLPGNRYRVALQVSSINFELKSEAEQDALIENYQSFLNSLACPLQILVRVREMDLDRYLEAFKVRMKDEKAPVYKNQIKTYSHFVAGLVSTNKILSRLFYVVIGHDGEAEFSLVKEQLSLNMDIVIKGLARLGMQSTPLSSLEILDLFYSFYNPAQAKTQAITFMTMELLARSYL